MKQKKNRVFIVAGYFHIIATVATIKTIEKESKIKEEFNDILVLHLDRQNSDILIKMARKLHSFSHIVLQDTSIFPTRVDKLKSFIISNNIDIDIAFLPREEFLCYLQDVYYDRLFYIYEGRASVVRDYNKNYEAIYILIPYIYANLKSIKYIDIGIFKEITNTLSNNANIKFDESKKSIVLLLDYIAIDNKILIDKCNVLIASLLDKYNDYNLYIKKHPRQEDNLEMLRYPKQNNIYVFKEDFIVETLCKYKNIEFFIGFHSTALLHCLYLYDIPSFYIENFTQYGKDFLLLPYFLPRFQDDLPNNFNVRDFKEKIHNNSIYINSTFCKASVYFLGSETFSNFYLLEVEKTLEKRKKQLKYTKLISAVIIIILLILLFLK